MCVSLLVCSLTRGTHSSKLASCQETNYTLLSMATPSQLLLHTTTKHCNDVIESPLADKRAIVVLVIRSFTSNIYKHMTMVYNHNLVSITLIKQIEDDGCQQPLFVSDSGLNSKHKTYLAERFNKEIIDHLRKISENSQSLYIQPIVFASIVEQSS